MTHNAKTSAIGLILLCLAVYPEVANAAEEMSRPEIPATAQMAAGILPFFDNGKTILLGQEFRERYNSHAWMEFGGKQDKNKTLAGTLCLPFQQVQKPEQDGCYIVDHYN